MAGTVIYTPPTAHECFPFGWPPEAGLFAALETRWRCDECGAVWVHRPEGWRQA